MRGNEHNKLRTEQSERFTKEKVSERFDEGSIPLSKIEAAPDDFVQLVLPVTEKDTFAHISTGKNHKPLVIVEREDGIQIHCTITYEGTDLFVSWNSPFKGTIYLI